MGQYFVVDSIKILISASPPTCNVEFEQENLILQQKKTVNLTALFLYKS